MVSKLVKEFAAYYGTRRFIAVFTRLICPYPEPDQSCPRPPNTFNSMIYEKKKKKKEKK